VQSSKHRVRQHQKTREESLGAARLGAFRIPAILRSVTSICSAKSTAQPTTGTVSSASGDIPVLCGSTIVPTICTRTTALPYNRGTYVPHRFVVGSLYESEAPLEELRSERQ
jgi:hypothetical protein